MKGRILHDYLQPKPTLAKTDDVEDTDGLDDLGAFGFLRGTHDRALMLELRRKDGTITAYPYAWLRKTVFNPSEGITLHFGAEKVRIIGRNFNAEVRPNVRLFGAIVRHRVPWVHESNESAAIQATKGATVIEEIKIG